MTGDATGGNGEVKRHLPPGWRWVKLGEVCEVVSKGTTPTSLGHSFTQFGTPFLRAEDVRGGSVIPENVSYFISNNTNDLLARSQLKPKDLLITIAGTLGRVGYIPDDATPMNCNQAVAFARLHAEIADVQFICYACQSEDIIAPLKILKAGGSVQNLNLEQVRNLRLPLPPLPEQKRIAAILTQQMAAVDRARAAAEAQLEAAQALPTAYLRQVIPKRGQPLPLGWRWVRLEEMCEFHHGGTPSKSNPGYWIGVIPWVSPKDMRFSRIMDSSDHISEDAVLESNTRIVSRDSILIVVRSGILARTVPIALCGVPVAFNQDIKAICPKMGVLDPRYLVCFLKSMETYILVNGIKKGATVHSVKSGFIESLEVPLPPISEQKRIAGILNEQMAAVEQVCNSMGKQISKINKLPAALLRRAFNGEL